MLFIPDEIDTVMLLREAGIDAQAVFLGAAANVISLPCIERTIAATGNNISIEHSANI